MAERCRLFLESPPENWDGVMSQQGKDLKI
jgi:hypothetical protein